MGFFSKSNDENNGFVIKTNDESVKISGKKNLAPHAMTANEVSQFWVVGDSVDADRQGTSALDSLKQRMNVSTDNDFKNENANGQEHTDIAKKISEKHSEDDDVAQSLIEKVKRYTIDEQGHDAAKSQGPLYHLESVAEILKSDSESALKELSKKYDIYIDDLGKSTPEKSDESRSLQKSVADKSIPKKPNAATPTPAFEQMVNDAAERENRELYENLFPSETKIEPPDISIPDISDIDTHEVGISNNEISNTATVRFTPVSDDKGHTDHITISNVTRHIDLDDTPPEDISSHSTTSFEQSDFEEFLPSCEYSDIDSGKRLFKKIARTKRTHFIGLFVSLLMLLSLSVFLIPFVYDHIISTPKITMLICSSFLAVSIISNINMFFDFKNIFKKRCSFDIMASLCSVSTLTLGITAALTDSNVYYIILLCSFLLLIRSVCRFKYSSAQLLSLKQIMNERPKNAVALINDPATAFAMVKNSIEGDALVAAHKKSNFIEDFMKHFEFHKTIFGKISIVFLITLCAALIGGITAYFYYDSTLNALYAFTCITCIAAAPTAFFIDAIPFSSAAKKLNLKGSMIAGIYGAQKIENANAAVIKSTDIFPEGTVILHNMKVLSNNNIDQTLMRAASLTAAVGSPLESIFRKIAGTNDAYSIPDADTIKYEKNLGISGWVDNEPLFIGNRSLMKAHGIEIPSLEVDKKILRKGYFPVYVATTSTACALIVIQYNVNPAVTKELHKITDLGVMLLIENCDPNITEEMVCDYFGLYDESVKVMSNAGVHMYKNAVPDAESCSAPAAYRGSGLNFIRVINRASGIKSANRLLTVMYTLFAVLGALYFVYAAFSGLMSMPEQTTVLLYEIGVFVLSTIGFLIKKP